MRNTTIRQISQKTIAALTLGPLFLVLTPLVAAYNKYKGIDTFFTQDRAGQNGSRFRAYKFQSMRPGNEPDSERVTGLGKLLRKSSLDEVPQLLNIFKDDMDLIGWRPSPKSLSDMWSSRAKINVNANQAEFQSVKEAIDLITQTKPGLLGAVQLSPLRGTHDDADKNGLKEIIALEKSYVETRQKSYLQAAWQDTKILLIAPYAITRHTGQVARTPTPPQDNAIHTIQDRSPDI